MTKTELKYTKFEAALAKAHEAASKAQKGLVENMNALDCGFAWAVVRDRGFQTFCRKRAEATKDRKYGSKHWAGGWLFWNPGDFSGQAIGIHEIGARAFRDSLAHELQILVEVGSRLD